MRFLAALSAQHGASQARRQALKARARQAERARCTRQLIRRGGVLAAWGVEMPEPVEAPLRDATATATGRWPGAGR